MSQFKCMDRLKIGGSISWTPWIRHCNPYQFYHLLYQIMLEYKGQQIQNDWIFIFHCLTQLNTREHRSFWPGLVQFPQSLFVCSIYVCRLKPVVSFFDFSQFIFPSSFSVALLAFSSFLNRTKNIPNMHTVHVHNFAQLCERS